MENKIYYYKIGCEDMDDYSDAIFKHQNKYSDEEFEDLMADITSKVINEHHTNNDFPTMSEIYFSQAFFEELVLRGFTRHKENIQSTLIPYGCGNLKDPEDCKDSFHKKVYDKIK